MQQTKLLIVEDDSIFLSALVWQLSKMGYDRMNIVSATSLTECQEVATEFEPDAILLDLNITDSQGIDTYHAVISIYPNAAIVILSGMNDEELALSIVKLGAQDYLLKSDVSSKILSKTIEYSKERKNLLAKLRASEFKYRNVFNQSPLPMFIIEGEDKIIIQANQSAENLYLYPEVDMIGKRLDELSIGEKTWIKNAENQFHIACVHQTKTGDSLHVEIFGKRLMDHQHDFICLVIDKSEEWAFEQKKYKLVSSAQENEKRKIAMELHDGLVQSLAVLSLWFNNLEISDDQQQLKEMFNKHLDNSIKEARGIAYSLSPPDLEEGFLHALETLTERVNRVGKIKVQLNVDEGLVENDFAQVDKFNLYRIVQEFLNNSFKHSGSDSIDIELKRASSSVNLIADDHGKGFDMNDQTVGLGIKSLLHRIKMGGLKGGINSHPGTGTQLELNIIS